MPRPDVHVFHPDPPADAGELTRLLAAARHELAEHHRAAFLAAGAATATIVRDPIVPWRSFGDRLATLIEATGEPVFRAVLLGSGSIPLASATDRRWLLDVDAGRLGDHVRTNNRYSSDAIAVSIHRNRLDGDLARLDGDNALPRYLAGRLDVTIEDARSRWRLQSDVDTPLDIVLLARHPGAPRVLLAAAASLGPDLVGARLAAIGRLMRDPRAQLVVTGRTSARSLGWLERSAACRVRALVEERGLRATNIHAIRAVDRPAATRPPASVLGALLDRDGPEALGSRLVELGDGALVDSRVLLAHRFGPDERAWPSPEDRYASDLLLHERVADPWLRALTASAAAASIPIVLGGHSLVGPGVRLVARFGAGG